MVPDGGQYADCDKVGVCNIFAELLPGELNYEENNVQ